MNLDVKLPNGKLICTLNKKLIKIKKVSKDNIEALRLSHVSLYTVKEEMSKTDDTIELKKLARQVEKIEYFQQELWGYKKNSNYHYWWKVPKCTCGGMDNMDSYGTKYRHIDSRCLVHKIINHTEPEKKISLLLFIMYKTRDFFIKLFKNDKNDKNTRIV